MFNSSMDRQGVDPKTEAGKLRKGKMRKQKIKELRNEETENVSRFWQDQPFSQPGQLPGNLGCVTSQCVVLVLRKRLMQASISTLSPHTSFSGQVYDHTVETSSPAINMELPTIVQLHTAGWERNLN